MPGFETIAPTQFRDVWLHSGTAAYLSATQSALHAVGSMLNIPPRLESNDSLQYIAQIHFDRVMNKSIQLEGKLVGAKGRARNAAKKENEALEKLGVLHSKLQEEVLTAKEKARAEELDAIRAELQKEFDEEMQRVADELAKEKQRLEVDHAEMLKNVHEVVNADAVRDAQANAIRQYKTTTTFHKILAVFMMKAVIDVGNKVRPNNPRVHWNTTTMIKHVQRWLSEKHSLDLDSQPEDEEEGRVSVEEKVVID